MWQGEEGPQGIGGTHVEGKAERERPTEGKGKGAVPWGRGKVPRLNPTPFSNFTTFKF